MRNRAKCKLCSSVIESITEGDHISCKCGEIMIYGGSEKFGCAANDFANFLRVDDSDNEVEVKVKGSEAKEVEGDPGYRVTRKDLMYALDEMVNNIQALPNHVMLHPINHYDFCSLLILLQSIFRMKDQEESMQDINGNSS